MGLSGGQRQRRFQSGLHHPAGQDRAGSQAQGSGQRRQPTVSGDRRRPRGRGHQLAPPRVAEAENSGPSAGVSRNHGRSDPRSAGTPARYRRCAGASPGNAADHRPAVRLRGFAPAVAQGPAAALGRTGAKRRRAVDRRARTRADGLRRGHVLGPDRHVCSRGAHVPNDEREQFEAGTGGFRRPPDPFDPRLRSCDRQAQGSRSLLLLDGEGAVGLAERLRKAKFTVAALDDKPYTTKPYPPFTTSTLQQEANRKLGFTARRTMQVAQSLYENGHITYMRTDSTNLASVAVDAARELVLRALRP